MPDQPIVKFMLTAKGAINLAFAAGLLAAPGPLMHLYGVALTPFGAFQARLLGAALLGIGAVQVVGRNAPRSALQSLFVGANAIADLTGLAVSAGAMLAGLMNPLGWGIPALYAFAGAGFSLAWLKECRAPAHPSPAPAR